MQCSEVLKKKSDGEGEGDGDGYDVGDDGGDEHGDDGDDDAWEMMTDDHEEVMAETAAITIFQGCKKRVGNFQLSPLSTQSAQRREGCRVVLTDSS